MSEMPQPQPEQPQLPLDPTFEEEIEAARQRHPSAYISADERTMPAGGMPNPNLPGREAPSDWKLDQKTKTVMPDKVRALRKALDLKKGK